MLNVFIKMFAKEQGIDIENSAEWRMDTKPLLIGAVDMMCISFKLLDKEKDE